MTPVKNFKLSIVIPTKNRTRYARWTVRAAVNLSPDFEVIVADSNDDESLRDALAKDGILERVVYLKTSPENSVVANFNEAVARARGDYVLSIGDDDIVLSSIIEVVEHAIKNEIDAVNFSFPVTYWWPDFVHRRRGKVDSGSVTVEEYSGRWKRMDPATALKEAMANLGGGPMNMPRIYAGMISRKIVSDIIGKHGALFGGVSPDIYSSTLLASECKRAFMLDFPVVVPGVSGASTSGQSSNGTHIGQLRNNAHMSPFKNLVWDERVPEFYSVPTVWGFSMLKALERLNLDRQANFSSLYLKCFLYHRQFGALRRQSVAVHRSQAGLVQRVGGMIRALSNESNFVFSAVWRRITQKWAPSSFTRLGGLENSSTGRDAIELHMQKVTPLTLPRVCD